VRDEPMDLFKFFLASFFLFLFFYNLSLFVGGFVLFVREAWTIFFIFFYLIKPICFKFGILINSEDQSHNRRSLAEWSIEHMTKLNIRLI